MPTATIKLYLPYGNPTRIRTGEISNWTGKAIAGPRSDLDLLLEREEAGHPGVYLLTGRDPENDGKETIYIGEAETIRDRIRSHSNKDYWNHLTYFISKDENLTKAHIRYLEGRLIALSREANRAFVKNDQNSGAKLPETDRADMEVFLTRIQQLLPILGTHVLVPISVPPSQKDRINWLKCRIKSLVATGYTTPAGFVVTKNSQAVITSQKSIPDVTQRIRDQFLSEGTLVLSEDKMNFIFTKDVEFSSPSAAAAVIKGGSTNGRTAWIDKDGRSLREIEGI